MPYLLNIITETPEDAIEAAIQNTIKRANDVWGLDYATKSDGLYPGGNQIGRTQFRPDIAHKGNKVFPKKAGGEWRTVNNPDGDNAGDVYGLATDQYGWAEWLDFNVDDDAFIIWEGIFNREIDPSIHEFAMNLNGTQLPPMQIDTLYATEEKTLRGYFEVPVVSSPTSEAIIKVRSDRTNLSAKKEEEGNTLVEKFGIIGDVIAKRPVLIKFTY